MNHDLAWVQKVAEGYEAECGCGARWLHGSSDAVRLLHAHHVEHKARIEDLRAALEEGKGEAG